jgi:hypothetical protein
MVVCGDERVRARPESTVHMSDDAEMQTRTA